MSVCSVADQGLDLGSARGVGLVPVTVDLVLVHDPSPGTALVPVLAHAQRRDLPLEKGRKRGHVLVPGMLLRSARLKEIMEIAEAGADPDLRTGTSAAGLAAKTVSGTGLDPLLLTRMPALHVRKRCRSVVPLQMLLSTMSRCCCNLLLWSLHSDVLLLVSRCKLLAFSNCIACSVMVLH